MSGCESVRCETVRGVRVSGCESVRCETVRG